MARAKQVVRLRFVCERITGFLGPCRTLAEVEKPNGASFGRNQDGGWKRTGACVLQRFVPPLSPHRGLGLDVL